MDNARASKVEEAKISQRIGTKHRITAPGPAAFHGINEPGHHHCEGEESKQFHPLRDRARDNGHGGGDKHNLEEEVGGRGIRSGLLCPRNPITCDATQQVIAAIHNGVAAYHVHGARHCEQRDVFGEDFHRVLASDQTGFKHCEASRHPHDQRAADQEVEGVQGILQLKNIVFHDSFLYLSG